MKTTVLVVTLLTVLSIESAYSATINQRQHKQTQRIGQGVKSGQLTAFETKRLLKQQANIAHTKRRFKADGQFTRGERARLQHMQNHASTHIFKQKHDAQIR
ncbi:MAG: hypothetical protein K0U68_09815 [Gammaproteobacteria bacterium]|nr:hypothetical protein [Gammaproteobacteria bacterium]